MASQKSFAAAFDVICTFLSARPPYCSGTYAVSPEQLTLFYGSDGSNVNRIDPAKATPQELNKLEAAFQPATFGVNNENIYAESYHKAEKMDRICNDQELLEGDDEDRGFKLELHKLNVYGSSSASLSLQSSSNDTAQVETRSSRCTRIPRGARPCLVHSLSFFPTPHEGGEFILRENEQEWVVDLAKSISESQRPRMSYVSFFSDVGHEVHTVTSGQCVALTYNSYFIMEIDVPVPIMSTPALYD
ncbi:hypothetical protein F5141DRAFT_1274463 [Pisolithus sp. B1]|nr:hypothetical protein F5141DRAFT_1274463 [Pisolithus sp. B1]